MSRAKPKRRWLQFSLRSILLLTLAVALWLGYEVRQARRVEQKIAALRALGGKAEAQPTGWSLLRLFGVRGYELRIVRAEIPGSAAEEAIPLLRGESGLREVQVGYDGAYDPTPSWRRINEYLPSVVLKPAWIECPIDAAWFQDAGAWKTSSAARGLERVRTRIAESHPEMKKHHFFERDGAAWDVLLRPTSFHFLALADKTLAELFVYQYSALSEPGQQDCFAALLVADKCVSVRGFSTSTRSASQEALFRDLDHDGFPELGFDAGTGWSGSDDRAQPLPGDLRTWLGVYKIERDGFKSLLPEDRSDFR
jgi:hypothetical protein